MLHVALIAMMETHSKIVEAQYVPPPIVRDYDNGGTGLYIIPHHDIIDDPNTEPKLKRIPDPYSKGRYNPEQVLEHDDSDEFRTPDYCKDGNLEPECKKD